MAGRVHAALLGTSLMAVVFGLAATLASEARADAPEPRADAVESTGHGVVQDEPHGDAHGHVPTFDDINWFQGMLFEAEGEPNLVSRPPGMPPPLGAMLLNSALLFFGIYYFGKKPIAEALKRRKLNIMQGMEDAARMRREAQERLDEYEDKLDKIDHEIERVKAEMQKAGHAERERILREARERQKRMERDAQTLIQQELKAARETLFRETVHSAARAAAEGLKRDLSGADHDRMAAEFLKGIEGSQTTWSQRS